MRPSLFFLSRYLMKRGFSDVGPTETMSISVSAKISIVSVEKNGKFMYHRTSASFYAYAMERKAGPSGV